MKLIKCAEFRKSAVECERNSKNSQNVPKSIFLEKLGDVFRKKHDFFKIAKDSKIVVECDWNITISQNVNFFLKNDGCFEKKWIFQTSVKVTKLS